MEHWDLDLPVENGSFRSLSTSYLRKCLGRSFCGIRVWNAEVI